MYKIWHMQKNSGNMPKRKDNSLKEKKNNWRVAVVILLAGILILFAVLFLIPEKEHNENNSQSSIMESTIQNDSIREDIRIKDSVIKAMVYMESSVAGGNGSIYEITEDEVIIVTTYHLLQDNETIGVRFYDNMYAEGSVIGVNEKHDVGFVKIPLNEIPGDTVQRIKAIQRNDSMYDSLSQGSPMAYHFLSYDGIFVCQETREGSIGAMNWYVEDFDDELIYNYCKIQPGMSGCAAVAEDGSYIGMVIGGYENESAALSIRVIDKVYQELEEFTKS